MDKVEIIKRNINDLNIGIELAEIAGNDFVKNYSNNRLSTLSSSSNSSYMSDEDCAKTYSIDLVLFIKISNIINDLDNKDYFKARLIDLCYYYPDIKSDSEVAQLI